MDAGGVADDAADGGGVSGAKVSGVGHLSEIADGDAPHMARGCPFQAWSVGELLRVEAVMAGLGKAAKQELVTAGV